MVVSESQLYFVGFIFEVTQYFPTALQYLPKMQLPQQNQADSGKTKLKSANPSR